MPSTSGFERPSSTRSTQRAVDRAVFRSAAAAQPTDQQPDDQQPDDQRPVQRWVEEPRPSPAVSRVAADAAPDAPEEPPSRLALPDADAQSHEVDSWTAAPANPTSESTDEEGAHQRRSVGGWFRDTYGGVVSSVRGGLRRAPTAELVPAASEEKGTLAAPTGGEVEKVEALLPAPQPGNQELAILGGTAVIRTTQAEVDSDRAVRTRPEGEQPRAYPLPPPVNGFPAVPLAAVAEDAEMSETTRVVLGMAAMHPVRLEDAVEAIPPHLLPDLIQHTASVIERAAAPDASEADRTRKANLIVNLGPVFEKLGGDGSAACRLAQVAIKDPRLRDAVASTTFSWQGGEYTLDQLAELRLPPHVRPAWTEELGTEHADIPRAIGPLGNRTLPRVRWSVEKRVLAEGEEAPAAIAATPAPSSEGSGEGELHQPPVVLEGVIVNAKGQRIHQRHTANPDDVVAFRRAFSIHDLARADDLTLAHASTAAVDLKLLSFDPSEAAPDEMAPTVRVLRRVLELEPRVIEGDPETTARFAADVKTLQSFLDRIRPGDRLHTFRGISPHDAQGIADLKGFLHEVRAVGRGFDEGFERTIVGQREDARPLRHTTLPNRKADMDEAFPDPALIASVQERTRRIEQGDQLRDYLQRGTVDAKARVLAEARGVPFKAARLPVALEIPQGAGKTTVVAASIMNQALGDGSARGEPFIVTANQLFVPGTGPKLIQELMAARKAGRPCFIDECGAMVDAATEGGTTDGDANKFAQRLAEILRDLAGNESDPDTVVIAAFYPGGHRKLMHLVGVDKGYGRRFEVISQDDFRPHELFMTELMILQREVGEERSRLSLPPVEMSADALFSIALKVGDNLGAPGYMNVDAIKRGVRAAIARAEVEHALRPLGDRLVERIDPLTGERRMAEVVAVERRHLFGHERPEITAELQGILDKLNDRRSCPDLDPVAAKLLTSTLRALVDQQREIYDCGTEHDRARLNSMVVGALESDDDTRWNALREYLKELEKKITGDAVRPYFLMSGSRTTDFTKPVGVILEFLAKASLNKDGRAGEKDPPVLDHQQQSHLLGQMRDKVLQMAAEHGVLIVDGDELFKEPEAASDGGVAVDHGKNELQRTFDIFARQMGKGRFGQIAMIVTLTRPEDERGARFRMHSVLSTPAQRKALAAAPHIHLAGLQGVSAIRTYLTGAFQTKGLGYDPASKPDVDQAYTAGGRLLQQAARTVKAANRPDPGQPIYDFPAELAELILSELRGKFQYMHGVGSRPVDALVAALKAVSAGPLYGRVTSDGSTDRREVEGVRLIHFGEIWSAIDAFLKAVPNEGSAEHFQVDGFRSKRGDDALRRLYG